MAKCDKTNGLGMSSCYGSGSLLALMLLLGACSWGPVLDAPTQPSNGRTQSVHQGSSLVKVTENQIGIPYRFGGSSPKQGFDCSGLVFYVHKQLGISVPRTSSEQYHASSPVKSGNLRPGDLLFYRTYGQSVSHVGVYVGGRRFLHAPNSSGRVRYANLDDAFWSNRFVGAGRFSANSEGRPHPR